MLKKTILIMLSFVMLTGCAAATIGSKGMGKEEKESLLRERAAANWQAMIDRDWGRVYDHYDPFFRSRITREWFIGQGMVIYYHGFKIEKVDMQGNVAKVAMTVEYSARHMGKFGKEIVRERTEKVIVETWLFVDNNWHRQYYDSFTDGTFAHY